MAKFIWDCKIGEVDIALLTPESDWRMRRAVRKAYKEITGQEPEFIFSGWGGRLTEAERSIVEDIRKNPGAADE
jgi:hypothetical protein